MQPSVSLIYHGGWFESRKKSRCPWCVRGHFSVDFLASKQSKSESWNGYAVEVTLDKAARRTHTGNNGTSLRWINLCYDGQFRINDGELRFYVATDCHYSENMKRCTALKISSKPLIALHYTQVSISAQYSFGTKGGSHWSRLSPSFLLLEGSDLRLYW